MQDNITQLSFEAELFELEQRIKDLSTYTIQNDININKELKSLNEKYYKKLDSIYKNLTPWQIVEVARHPERPHANDYIHQVFTDFFPLKGDRCLGDDRAVIAGLAKLDNTSVAVIGIEKGNSLEDKMVHNFGMPNPWGYRKAIRIMELANQFNLPIITLIDTPGAYPGIEAEERGQGHVIAESIATCIKVDVPLISVIIGEGGSGGALALAAGDATLMLQYAIYSVISPEGCASILWKDNKYSAEAAKNLSLTAKDLLKFGIIDTIIPEPLGGAHRDKAQAVEYVKAALQQALHKLLALKPQERKNRKQNKLLSIGRLAQG